MAEIFDFHVQDDRSILIPQNRHLEPIMQEDHKVATWRFRIPKVLNQIDMSGWSWWFVYVNAKGQEFSELLTLTDDIDEPSSYSTADYDIDYGISKFPGSFSFALEAISTEQGGEINGEWHTKTYKHKVDKTLQGNHTQWSETESDIISALIVEVQNKVAQLVGGATPEPKNLVADMTDPKKVYLYVGSEDGESANYWYYYNGSAWVAGGLYASGITVDAVPTQGSTNAVQSGGVKSALDTLQAQIPQIDATLSQSGQAADAKKTGDKITGLKEDLNGIETKLFTISDNLFNIDDIYTNKIPGSVGSSYDTMVTLNGWCTSNFIPVTEGEQYALIYLNTITQGAIFRIAGYSNGIMTYKTSGSTEPNPFTIPSGVDHVRFYSNTANLFNNRTNTSFKKYSADMSKAWTPYGVQENFLVKGAMPEYGVYVDGTNYYHFVRFGEKTLIRRFKREGPNNLFQFSALYTGEVSEHGVSINETIATNSTDTVGPISIMRQGVDSGGMWSSGWHTRTVNGVTCPTAEQQSLDIKINGESIVGVDGLHYGECVVIVVNKLYFPQTITGTDLSTAIQAIQETVTYTLNEKMTARVAHKYVADTRVILYYGMQAVRIGFDNILLPNNETVFTFADMTANINLDKPEDLIQMSNSEWNYDLVMKPFGLAKYTHNSGAGSTKYGYLPVSTRKVYWALMEGAYDYTFITSGKVLVREGVWDIYPN